MTENTTSRERRRAREVRRRPGRWPLRVDYATQSLTPVERLADEEYERVLDLDNKTTQERTNERLQ